MKVLGLLFIFISIYFQLSLAQNKCSCNVALSDPNDAESTLFCLRDPSRDNCDETKTPPEVCPCSAQHFSECISPQEHDCVQLGQPQSSSCLCGGSGSTCVKAFPLNTDTCAANQICGCERKDITTCDDTTCYSFLEVSSSGTGDPHFVGFDGTKFDFHGVHHHSYLIFGHRHGDLLTALVRATPEIYKGVNKTYFEQFGIVVGGEFKSVVLTSLSKVPSGEWNIKAVINGQVISSNMSLAAPETSLQFDPIKRTVIVQSPRTKFTVRGVSLRSDFRRHIDFEIVMKKKVSKEDGFFGVLGMTLNRKLGSTMHDKLFNDLKKKTTTFSPELEFALRKQFSVSGLVPQRDEVDRTL